jgi:hypothetical protein
MRAEEPGKLIYELVGGGQNARGFTALENPLLFQHGPPHYVLQRRLVSSQNDRSAQKRPEINVYSRLEIGHKDYAGCQFVYCKPFKKFHNDLRMDYVFFIPPPPFYTGRREDFQIDLDSCWYGRVVLLFRMKVKADSG